MSINLNYYFITFLLMISIFLSFFLVFLSFFFFSKKKIKNIEKKSLYECGFESYGDSSIILNIQYITVSIIFIILDLEILFIVPWILTINHLNFLGFFSFYIITSLFIYGFFYEWKLGSLLWKKSKYLGNNLLKKKFFYASF